MAYHSNGAFNQDIVYNLPVYLRLFYLKKLIDVKEKEKELAEKGSSNNSNKMISPPTIKNKG